MLLRGRHLPSICSALLGVLAISCGVSPEGVPGPAAERAPSTIAAPDANISQPRGGLAQEGPFEPAPAAPPPPAPAALPPQVPPQRGPNPAPEPRRAPGNPPGLRAPDIPNVPSPLDKEAWTGSVASRCNEEGYPNDCLGVEYIFYEVDKEKGTKRKVNDPGGDYSNCVVTRRDPRGGQYMTLGSSIRLYVACTSTSNQQPEELKQDQHNKQDQDDK